MPSGSGWKSFTSASLTADDVNGYLMSQAVMVFDSSTTRSATLVAPTEGMVTYLKDTNLLQYYSGSAWVGVGGGVTSLTTSSGLSTNTGATGAVSITNTGVTSLTSSSGLSTNTSATGAVSVTNTGVTSNVAGTGVGVSSATGASTISIGQSVATSASPTFSNVNLTAPSAGLTIGSWSSSPTAWGAVEGNRGYLLLHNTASDSNVYLRTKTDAGTVKIGSNNSNTLLVGDGYTTANGQFTVGDTLAVGGITYQGGQPYFVAGNASGSSGSSVVKVTWTVVHQGGNFSSSQFNVPVTGRYFFSTQVRIDGATAGGYMRCAIVRNNGSVYTPPNLHAIFGGAHSSDYHSMAVSGVMYCVAGDNVSVWAGREGGSSSFQNESTFTGWFLG